MKSPGLWMTFFVAAAVASFCAPVYSSDVVAESGAHERTRTESPSAPLPFEPVEQLVYEAEFSKLLLRGIKIAEFRFTATRAPASDVSDVNATAPTTRNLSATTNAAEESRSSLPQPLPVKPTEKTGQAPPPLVAANAGGRPLLFVADLTSKGWFRKLFGINFHFRVESAVEPESFAVLRTKKLDEQGKRVRISEAVFDRAGNRIAWTERDPNNPQREPRVVTNPLDGAMHDIISAIYFLRTQPLTPGRTFDLVLSDSGQVYHVPARVSKETKPMKSPLGRVSVVRVDIELFGPQRPVEGKGQMSMWVTNDARRLPVRARLSNDLGTLDISLKSLKTK